MNDRELLELAAKAYGGFYSNAALWIGREVIEYEWNPLDNDAHALRLAVKLNLDISHSWTFTKSEMEPLANILAATGDEEIVMCELKHSDSYAATRRAIVRAAAEIGKSMP